MGFTKSVKIGERDGRFEYLTERGRRRSMVGATSERILERIRPLIVEKLGVEEERVVPVASFADDLNAHKVSWPALIMAVEEEFAPFVIPPEDEDGISTVQNMVDYLTRQGVRDK